MASEKFDNKTISWGAPERYYATRENDNFGVAEMLPEAQAASAKRTPTLKLRLTDANVPGFTLPEGKNELLVWDVGMNGLALRVGKQRRAWVYVYRPAGMGARANPQKIGLGVWPAITVAKARQLAQAQAGHVASGKDPAAERREKKRIEASSVEKMLEAYEWSLMRRAYANLHTTMSVLRRGLAGLEKRDVATLTRRELVTCIDNAAVRRVVETPEEKRGPRRARKQIVGGPGASDHLRTRLRTFFEWTTNVGITPANPLAGLRRERSTRAQRISQSEKGRALTADELGRIWNVADPSTTFGRYIRALILTGARRREMSRLTWAMVRSDRLVLPPSHTKQGRPHEIPIVPLLRSTLARCPRLTTGVEFASRKTGGEMSGWTKMLDRLEAEAGVRFTLHDLRRTMRSGLTELGIDDTTAEMMLAHQRDELERIYDKNDRWSARVLAARRWAARVFIISRKARAYPAK